MTTSRLATELGPPQEADFSPANRPPLALHHGRAGSAPAGAAATGGLLATRRGRRAGLGRASLPFADAASTWLTLSIALGAFGISSSRLLATVGATLILLICKLNGSYDRDDLHLNASTLDEVPAILMLTGVLTLALTVLLPAVGHGLAGEQVPALWIALVIGVLGGRGLSRLLAGRLAEPQRCLVIGDPDQADHLRERMRAGGSRAAVIATVPINREDLAGAPAELRDAIRALAEELSADRIIVAPRPDQLAELPRLIRVAKGVGLAVSVMPALFACAGGSVAFDDVNGLALLGMRPLGLSRSSLWLKRGFDLIVATIAVTLLSPILALIALAIRMDGGGPIMFRQTRVGRHGKHFEIIKFRSMVTDAETLKEELRAFSEVGEGMFKISDDPRVTTVGRFLRRSSLDELPQIFNVLRGEMSLVGPRPLVIDEDAAILGLDRSRLHLMPGMTGPWQVLRTRVSRREMIEIDYRYVASWSVWLDLKILIRTALHVVRRRNV